MRLTKKIATFCCAVVFAASCTDGSYNPLDPTKKDIIDPAGNLGRDDFKQMRDLGSYQKKTEDGLEISMDVSEPPIPDLAEILASPRPPKVGETQLVSVAVTDDVPLKDVLIELARLADVDVEVDAGVTGGISFRAKDRPFNEVIERIASLAGLRYSMKHNVLRVERDLPYISIYTLDLLNLDRSSTGNIGVNTSVGGGSSSGSSGSSSNSSSSNSGSGGGGDKVNTFSANSGSTSNITASTQSDFWKQFEESIKQILAYTPPTMVSATSVATQPAPMPPAGNDDDEAPPRPPTPVAISTPSPAAVTAISSGSFFILNRQASTLTVSATEHQHEIIREFLKRIQANVASQVLIEAKIVEVNLSDEYKSGVDWTKLGGSRVGFAGKFDGGLDSSALSTFTFNQTDIGSAVIDLNAAVQLAETFGTTRALSSPRLHAMNNQQAVLNFTKNEVYFDIDVDITDATSGGGGSTATPGKIEVTTTRKVAPVGLILNLLPSVNADTNEVTLNVRPTLSRKVGEALDPALSFAVAKALAVATTSAEREALLAIKSPVPIIETREMDSVLKLKSGQVMVIGGLMEDSITNTDSGLPGVSSIPWFGNAFKSVNKLDSKKELVIFIRATIVGTSGSGDKADKALYRKFIQDPRPLEF